MSSVWYTKILDSSNWQTSRDGTPAEAEIRVASWPLRSLGELIVRVDEAGVAKGRPPLITPRDIETDTGAPIPRERAGLQPVFELGRQLAEADILLPPSFNRPALLVAEAHKQFAFSTAFIPLRVNVAVLDPRYAWMLLSSSRGMRARAALSRWSLDWEALQHLCVAVPPLAIQRAQSVPVPDVHWVEIGSKWHLANLRDSQAWGIERMGLGGQIRLSDIAHVSNGVVDGADVFAVPGSSRVPVLTDIDRADDVPYAWASVTPDKIGLGTDIAVSPYFPFRACRVPAGWAVSQRFLVVRAFESTRFAKQPTADALTAWLNSISGREALATVARGTVLPRLTVSELGRVTVPEATTAPERSAQPLAVRLEQTLGLL
jgi:hypothetical protein